MTAAIFDLDGTLLNSLEDLANSLNIVLERKGLPKHSLDAYRHFVGNGMAKLVQRALGEEYSSYYDEVYDEFLNEYEKRFDEKSRPYEGVLESLETLKERDVKMAICTNKKQAYTNQIIRKFFSSTDFIEVVGDRDDGHRKPSPYYPLQIAEAMNQPVEKIYFVGDSDVDMQTAKNAGMIAVGVSWGFRGRKELEAAGADIVIDHPLELCEVIQ